ncbi:phage tail protein [Pseudoalteromonas ardens]|uniref:Phage tail collar domain-containing protein n=1 Tax=Pseudoalteromonas rubra TaxID=43658 RepID=A0A0L0EQG5_9GAMM|nr:tail fiber protein [Pseudoalteromonas sp. R96]KNC66123.1 hypothetical protein AC626_18920 [Pseudoalteromonas rubra]MDK1312236.1 tail fiber protein [Pseudoalteromonas sp. R96]
MQVVAYQGDMMPFGGDFSVEGYAPCNGTPMSINQNQALFTLLGTKYGGDGRTIFALPDLRGRSPIGYGHGPGLNYHPLGMHGGEEHMTLKEKHVPQHTHTGTLTVASNKSNELYPSKETYFGQYAIPGGTYFEPNDFEKLRPKEIKGVTTDYGPLDGGHSFSIRDPYLAIGWLICHLGAYPRRA